MTINRANLSQKCLIWRLSALYLPWAVEEADRVRRNVQMVTYKSPFTLSKDVGDEERNAFLWDAKKTFRNF